jgi:hypothetical protein
VKRSQLESDLKMFEGDLPYLEEMLREVRRSVECLRDIALANDADPNAEPSARLVTTAHAACDSIAAAISEAKKQSAILRAYTEASPGVDTYPAEITESWEIFRTAHSYARQELLRMGATF